ncbi:AmmeMemoRadiSam system radical SAM enzyme [Pararhodospirillum photometricum]|uniref:AmmeMemoRadiSam system radical SAM enzyme n=1 Tax=Pararhodospirillum photometricum TaxID=1084 RepID=UPI000684A4A1|nr:AmmeMemoRadiSam system radical SAM enzyme [Pararhodospirillum photometricum]
MVVDPVRQDAVVCSVCPRACALRPGQSGLCVVRANEGGRIVLTAWGRSSGFAVDPIEKKPLYHFLPGTPVLSFGGIGCNLTCLFCQNSHLSRARDLDRLGRPVAPEDLAAGAREHGCRSVAFTYNDPVPMLEYVADVARACHAEGLRTVAVTAGYITPEARPTFFADIDAANVDLKAFSEGFYRRMASAHLAPVLDTLAWLARETAVWLELTTLLIPGLNDSDDEIKALAAWVAATLGPHVPLHLSAFHPAHRLRHLPPTPLATLRHARALAQAEGLAHVYLGNVRDPDAGTTFCPACHARLIGREGFRLVTWSLDAAGRCLACGHRLAGVFEAR